MKKILGILVLLMVCAAVASPVAATTATQKQRVVASPSSVELVLAPGESATKVITVVNKGTEAFMLGMSAAPYSIRSEDYSPQYVLLPGTQDASKWVSFISPSAEVRVDPEKVQEVTYEVSVPTTAKPGGHYVALFLTTTPDPLPISVVAHNRIAIMQYITVKGDTRQSGQVDARAFGSFVWGSTLTMPYSIKNTGEEHFIAKVSAVVKTVWGSEVSRMSEERYVLPQTERLIILDWQTKGAFGIYRVEQSAEYLGRTEQLSGRWIVVTHPLVLLGVVLFIIGGTLFFVVGIRGR